MHNVKCLSHSILLWFFLDRDEEEEQEISLQLCEPYSLKNKFAELQNNAPTTDGGIHTYSEANLPNTEWLKTNQNDTYFYIPVIKEHKKNKWLLLLIILITLNLV